MTVLTEKGPDELAASVSSCFQGLLFSLLIDFEYPPDQPAELRLKPLGVLSVVRALSKIDQNPFLGKDQPIRKRFQSLMKRSLNYNIIDHFEGAPELNDQLSFMVNWLLQIDNLPEDEKDPLRSLVAHLRRDLWCNCNCVAFEADILLGIWVRYYSHFGAIENIDPGILEQPLTLVGDLNRLGKYAIGRAFGDFVNQCVSGVPADDRFMASLSYYFKTTKQARLFFKRATRKLQPTKDTLQRLLTSKKPPKKFAWIWQFYRHFAAEIGSIYVPCKLDQEAITQVFLHWLKEEAVLARNLRESLHGIKNPMRKRGKKFR